MIVDYYTELYAGKEINMGVAEEMINGVKNRITEADGVFLNSDISREEISKAISSINKGRSPGEDGFVAELYVKLNREVSKLLHKIFNHMWQGGMTPADFSNGFITLVYKNKGCREEVANYRPISLLNSDFKILAKVMVNRCKGIVEQIIGSDQAYGEPRKDIADSILTA